MRNFIYDVHEGIFVLDVGHQGQINLKQQQLERHIKTINDRMNTIINSYSSTNKEFIQELKRKVDERIKTYQSLINAKKFKTLKQILIDDSKTLQDIITNYKIGVVIRQWKESDFQNET